MQNYARFSATNLNGASNSVNHEFQYIISPVNIILKCGKVILTSIPISFHENRSRDECWIKLRTYEVDMHECVDAPHFGNWLGLNLFCFTSGYLACTRAHT